jgi:threonyl-tRNA synthetase
VEVDERSERMNSKIRDAQKQKIPYMLVVGDQEMDNKQVALRLRNGENPGAMSVADFLVKAKKDIETGE